VSVETGWERRFPFRHLCAAEIEARIEPFAPGARVLEAEPLRGGLRNTNYRVRLSTQEEAVVLRVYAQDEMHGACGRELALSRLLNSHIPKPRVLHAEPDADPPWAILTYVDGVRFDEFLKDASVDAIQATSRSAGRVLAAIHAYEFERPGWFGPDLSLGKPPWPDMNWAEMLSSWLINNNLGTRLGPELRDRVLRFVESNAASMAGAAHEAHLVHSDFKPWNLLVGNNDIVAVVDWEGSYSGNSFVDLGIYLRYSASYPPAYRDGFASGYLEGGGHLPGDWFRRARVTDLLNLGFFVAFRNDPTVDHDIKPLIETTLAEFAP
jgi:aminoglycoside phosphotransferase (APT) family kinase protein